MADPKNKLKSTQYHRYPPSEIAGDEFVEIQFSAFEGYIIGSSDNPVTSTSISVDFTDAIPGTEVLMFHSAVTKPTFNAGDPVTIIREIGDYTSSVVNPISILYVGGSSVIIVYVNESQESSNISYSSLQGTVGWAKIVTLSPVPGEQLEYSIVVDVSYISDVEQFYYGNVVFHVEYLIDGTISYIVARSNGNVSPSDFVLVDTGDLELYFQHSTANSEIRFKSVVSRIDDYFTLHDKLAIIPSLPVGDQYEFEEISDQTIYDDLIDSADLKVVGGTSGEYTLSGSTVRRIKKDSIMFFEVVINFATTAVTPTGAFYVEIPDVVGVGDETTLVSANFNRVYNVSFLDREKQIDLTTGSRLIFRNDSGTTVQCDAIPIGAALTIKGFARTSL